MLLVFFGTLMMKVTGVTQFCNKIFQWSKDLKSPDVVSHSAVETEQNKL